MPLIVHLRRGQQVIINGAVLENASDRSISICLKNEVSVLRSDDILSPSAAVTPASRAYYALQCAYLFPDQTDKHLATFAELISAYLEAAPSATGLADEIGAAVQAGNLYGALKWARALIEHERKVLTHVEARLAEKLYVATPPGEPAEHRGVGPNPGREQVEGGPGVRRS